MVRTWPNSYSRANLSKMFKLRTNARAEDDRVSPLMACGELLSTPDITVERNPRGDKPASGRCHHMTNTTQVANSVFLSRKPPLCVAEFHASSVQCNLTGFAMCWFSLT